MKACPRCHASFTDETGCNCPLETRETKQQALTSTTHEESGLECHPRCLIDVG
jgi:hypothetical protein